MRTTLATLTLLFACLSQAAHAQQPSGSPTVGNQQQAADTDGTQPQQIAQEKSDDFWMSQKLEYSKAILQSLTSGDFKTLASEAEKMRRLAKIEGFVRRRNKSYLKQLEAFNLANDALVRSAEATDIENSLKAFHKLTTSCVACHELLRAKDK